MLHFLLVSAPCTEWIIHEMPMANAPTAATLAENRSQVGIPGLPAAQPTTSETQRRGKANRLAVLKSTPKPSSNPTMARGTRMHPRHPVLDTIAMIARVAPHTTTMTVPVASRANDMAFPLSRPPTATSARPAADSTRHTTSIRVGPVMPHVAGAEGGASSHQQRAGESSRGMTWWGGTRSLTRIRPLT